MHTGLHVYKTLLAAAMRAVRSCILLCALGQCVAHTVCGDWKPNIMAEFKDIMLVSYPTSSQTDDLKSFQSHHAFQLKWANKHGDEPRVEALTTGACGQFAAQVDRKLAEVRATQPAQSRH